MVRDGRRHRRPRSPVLPGAAARRAHPPPGPARAPLRYGGAEHLVRRVGDHGQEDRGAQSARQPDPEPGCPRAHARLRRDDGPRLGARGRRGLPLPRAGLGRAAVPKEIRLRYGLNPHQTPARAFASGDLPFTVRNGAPGMINLLDALNAWQLVRELRQVTGHPAAASFKHVSPAGVGLAFAVNEQFLRAYPVPRECLSPLGTAYTRARSADRISTFGDIAAFSDTVDERAANALRREVSDGCIAPGYDPKALAILSRKKDGAYLVLEVDPSYQPGPTETRDVFGVTLEQRRNDHAVDASLLRNVVTKETALPERHVRDLLVGLITLKYTQSNSVAFVLDGTAIGIGAGQQSRIHCTRLAAQKAELWWLRQHPRVLDLTLRADLSRPERDNAIDGFLRDDLTPPELVAWRTAFDREPQRLSADERREWLDKITPLSYVSDAFLPFRDNVDRARAAGAKYVAQPGGSARDAEVIAACDEHGMVMAFTGVRLFHH
ncbi:MAG: phosphoribosylaminoimidazolecarboxamide formyltransferase [Chloroflexi bacterium]|nr:phosphoribosylaminoimidazolecarboxamide formyltransferase [Chloroflexota bacterium]